MKQPPIFVINLDKDFDKKDYMLELEKKNNLKFNFIEAVFGKELSKEELDKAYCPQKALNALGRELSLGEIGCSLSHISIYKKMIEENIPLAIILEDDIEIKENFLELLSKINSIKLKWDVLLLGYYSRVLDERKSRFKIFNQIRLFKNTNVVKLVEIGYGAHGYAITKKGAELLIENAIPISKPIDHYTGVNEYIVLCAISPRPIRLAKQFIGTSTIDLERDNKTDKGNFTFNLKYKIKRFFIYKLLQRGKLLLRQLLP